MGTPLTVPRPLPAVESPEGPAANIYPDGEHQRAVWRLEKFGARIDNDMIEILRPFHDRNWPRPWKNAVRHRREYRRIAGAREAEQIWRSGLSITPESG
jgi:hypothetical protein